jgi:hypothetical protein
MNGDTGAMRQLTYREAVREAIREALHKDERVFSHGRGRRPLRGLLRGQQGSARRVRSATHPCHPAVGIGLCRC